MDKQHKVLLTGASGYIGSQWLEHISPSVQKVVLNVKSKTVDPFMFEKPHVIREGVIPSVDPEVLIEGVDVVVHLAADITRKGNTDHMREINAEWTKRLGEACARRGVKLLFVSTSSLYAGVGGALLKEDTHLIRPQNAYAETKYEAEESLNALKTQGLSYSILRLGSVFGVAPHIRLGTINLFVQQALSQLPVDVWRVGIENMRPYTHIDDVVGAINHVIEKELFSGETYNVVSENMTTNAVLDCVRTVAPDLAIRLVDDERMNTLSYGLDDTKIRKTGFSPHHSLREGVRQLVEYFQEHAQATQQT